jgi:hypothetical protein
MAISGKLLALSAAALALSLPAAALAETPPAPQQKKICIDPHYSYQARYLSGHDIIAKATLGSDHRELKLATTCLFLTSVYDIALHSDFKCIDKGDDVFTSTIDGHHQHCIITHVEPYVPAHPEPQG